MMRHLSARVRPISRFSVLAVSLIAALVGCGRNDKPIELRTRNFTLTERPDRVPLEVPDAFHYTGSKLVSAGVYEGGNLLSSLEGAFVSETADDPDTVEKFYQSAFAARGWNIIQSVQEKDQRLLMGESTYQKLVTVIIRSGNPTVIKVYFKRKDADS